ncbi:MAG: DoxX family protein [Acidobacteria bacterium]|nr:DoxX family protein [Acidobacteriota bacterium]
MSDLFLPGRIVFGGIFTYYGLNHFINTAMMTEYAASKGVPMPELAVLVSGTLLVVGGLMLVAVPRPWPYSLEQWRRVHV